MEHALGHLAELLDGRLDEVGHGRLGHGTEAERRHGDAELAAGQLEVEAARSAASARRAFRSPPSASGSSVDRREAIEGELDGDEEGVGEQQARRWRRAARPWSRSCGSSTSGATSRSVAIRSRSISVTSRCQPVELDGGAGLGMAPSVARTKPASVS